MNLSQIKQTLTQHNIVLTKSLGQNFLHDGNQLRRIAAAAELVETDQVLEIGPGLGALTHVLLEKVPHVFAIEKDHRLHAYLRQSIPDERRLTLLHADALRYLETATTDWSNWKLVSNLPYSVASPILVELAKTAAPPERLVVTLQLEVAKRLAATVDSDDYGVLSLLVQLKYQPRDLVRISATSFFPVPDVESACATLVRRSTPLLPANLARPFEKIVKRGFSQRRKMMMKLLKADWALEKLEKAFGELGLSPQARAETVSLEGFVQLTKLLAAPPLTPP